MGMYPSLTEAQRAAVIQQWKDRNAKRRELRQAIAANKVAWRDVLERGKKLRAELRALPSNDDMAGQLKISSSHLSRLHLKHFKTKHPADRAPRA